MCKHKILAENNSGYILFCGGCGNYQMAFGTSIVNFEPADFKNFGNHITRLKKATSLNSSGKIKQMSVNIYCKNAMMILNQYELFELDLLLEEAQFSEEIECVLEECHIKQSEH